MLIYYIYVKIGYKIIIYTDLNTIDDGYIQLFNTTNNHNEDNNNNDNNNNKKKNTNNSNNNDNTTKQGSIIWLHHSKYNIYQTCNIFISWRYSISFSLGSHCKKSYLWLHDLITGHVLPPSLFIHYTGNIIIY